MKIEVLCVIDKEEALNNFLNYLQEKESAKATREKYIHDVKMFFSFLGGQKEIDKKCLIQYKKTLIGKYKISSVNSMLAALNQFLICMDAEYLKVKRVKVQKQPFIQEEKMLTEKEYKQLLKTAMDIGNEQLALCIETIACTGIRISELKYFTYERTKQGKIEVLNKNKYRRILIPKTLKVKLQSFCKRNKIKQGPIFRTKNGNLKDRSNLWREMKNLAKKAKIESSKIYPHNLRHLFARTYYKNTKDITGLADILGHSSINVTRIYTATTEKFFQKQLDRLGNQMVVSSTT